MTPWRPFPGAGIVGPRIIDSDGVPESSVRGFPTVIDLVLYQLKLHRWAQRIPTLRRYFMIGFDDSQPAYVDQVIGAAMIVRRSDWDAIGGMDGGFFLLFEDVDVCKRLADRGHRAVHWPQMVVRHVGHESFRRLGHLRVQRLWNSERDSLCPKAPWVARHHRCRIDHPGITDAQPGPRHSARLMARTHPRMTSTLDSIAARTRDHGALRFLLVSVAILAILLLTYLRVVEGPRSIELGLQFALLVSFGLLAVFDFRTAVAIVIVELIVFGSSGQWTQLPGGIPGRIALYSIVVARAAGTIIIEWFRGDRGVLGRGRDYTPSSSPSYSQGSG